MPVLAGLATLAVLALDGQHPQAHKPVTSKYTYNDDVFPIFRDQCGRCHAPGAAVPMSLLTYQDARPWAESIREELTSERMPPWDVDPSGPSVRGGHPINARDIDTIVTWATGGTPEGSPGKRPAPAAPRARWPAGPPDLTLVMDREHTVASSLAEETVDFSWPTAAGATKWVKAVDLLPGTASMVRDAVVSIENGAVLATWIAGDDPVGAPPGAAFRLPAGATIRLRVHYRKPWQEAQIARSDRSTVGLYFTDPPGPGAEIQTLVITGRPAGTLGGTLMAGGRVVALSPSLDRAYRSLDVHAVTPSGARVPLLRLRAPRPEWHRRYWLAQPVELPAGSRVEATGEPLDAAAGGGALPRDAFQVAVDYVSR